jgi:hypothetical protein
VLFSPEGPHAWKTKKGSENLARDVENAAVALGKGQAMADIEKIAGKDTRTEKV